MLVTKSADVRDNFKSLCDQVYHGKTVVVARPRNENVIMISEKVYNDLQKAKRNEEYLKLLDESIKQIENGDSVIINDISELTKYE